MNLMGRLIDSRCSIRLLLALLLLNGLFISSRVQAEEPDWRLYQQLLEQHLGRETRHGIDLAWLDYSTLSREPAFKQLVAQLGRFPTDKLATRQERLAFYINAYNILAINLVLKHWPVASIKDAAPWYRSVWKLEAGQLDQKPVSLDTIEHQILRNMDEPRIHFAIVCASLSCPDLRPEPYRAEQLEAQLEDQTRAFIANRQKGVDPRQQGLYLSKIFDWFETDFGGPERLPGWLANYRDGQQSAIAGYLPYRWELNGQ